MSTPISARLRSFHRHRQLWEASTGRLLKTWWWLGEEQALAITPSGHYRGSRSIDEHVVYLALTDDGSQKVYSPTEFEKAFG